MAAWQKVFFIASGVYIFCATFYNFFASGKRQPWDNPDNDFKYETKPTPITTTSPNNETQLNHSNVNNKTTNEQEEETSH